MLTVTGLRVSYGRAVKALHKVDLQVPDGEVIAVLGANGAGKTTLMRAISGVLPRHRGRIDAGEIKLGDTRLDRLKPHGIVGHGIVQSPEGRGVFTTMTVEENLRTGTFSRRPGDFNATKKHVYDLFPILEKRARQRAGLLSGGEQQMLAIGRALIAHPRFLLLDEPSLGLAPQMVEQIATVIREIQAEGTAVLLVEQNAHMALEVSTAAVVLESGNVSLSGRSADLASNPEIQQLYLGHSPSHGPSEDFVARPSLTRWSA